MGQSTWGAVRRIFSATMMKSIVLMAVLFYSASLGFDLNFNPESESSRSFCCVFYNAQTECASRCAGRDCSEQCNTFCGITNSLCGSMTCSSVTTNCVTTAAPTTASDTTSAATSAASSNCLPSGTGECANAAVTQNGTVACCNGACAPTAGSSSLACP